jgi:hypothetical protein
MITRASEVVKLYIIINYKARTLLNFLGESIPYILMATSIIGLLSRCVLPY